MAAVIGEAITSLSRGKSAGDKEMEEAREIFSMIGDVVEVDEKLVGAVTAISGSGPAYFFYVVESLIEAAKSFGFDDETASKLVLKTALGSAKLLEALKEDPAVLCRKVASKGGTTEAALSVFDKKKLKNIIKDAAKAALKRSDQLSKR
jgi:pyrroline-5-carboxylate reductase